MGLVRVVAALVGVAALFALLVWAEVQEDADRAEHAAYVAQLDALLQATRRAHPDLPVLTPRPPAPRRAGRISRVLAGVLRGPAKWTG